MMAVSSDLYNFHHTYGVGAPQTHMRQPRTIDNFLISAFVKYFLIEVFFFYAVLGAHVPTLPKIRIMRNIASLF